MHLVQLLLPVSNLKGDETAAATFREIDAELTVPGFPSIRSGGGATVTRRDSLVVLEVMTDALDLEWWHADRNVLAGRLGHGVIIVRASPIELL